LLQLMKYTFLVLLKNFFSVVQSHKKWHGGHSVRPRHPTHQAGTHKQKAQKRGGAISCVKRSYSYLSHWKTTVQTKLSSTVK
jgi:hypothetical protein